MKQTDWMEYFEAVNGRSATAEEIAQALANGEFMAEEPTPVEAVEASQPAEAPVQPEAQAAPVQPAPATQAPVNTTAPVSPAPQATTIPQPLPAMARPSILKEYWDWYLSALKQPFTQDQNTKVSFPFVLALITALFSGFAVKNWISRIIGMFLNMNVDGKSFKTDSLEMYTRVNHQFEMSFGFGFWLKVSLLIFLVYVLVIFLPHFVNKVSDNSRNILGYAVANAGFLAPLSIIALVASLVTFFIPGSVTLTAADQMSLAFSQFSNIQNWTHLSEYLKLFPGMNTVVSISYVLFALVVAATVLLLIVVARNVKVKIGPLDNLYVSWMAAGVAIAFVYFINNSIVTSIIENFFKVFLNLSTMM